MIVYRNRIFFEHVQFPVKLIFNCFDVFLVYIPVFEKQVLKVDFLNLENGQQATKKSINKIYQARFLNKNVTDGKFKLLLLFKTKNQADNYIQ